MMFSKKENQSKKRYQELRTLFPNVDPGFIKDICEDAETIGATPDETMHGLIEVLLEHGKDFPYVEQKVHTTKSTVAESIPDPKVFKETYENLFLLFPKADTNYLRKFVKENIHNPDAIQEFIQTKLETHDYPTMENYFRDMELSEQFKQYVSKFNAQFFLELIPDPVKHFENPDRKQKHNPIAFDFLNKRYNTLDSAVISETYTKFKHNLTLTAINLDRICPKFARKKLKKFLDAPISDIPLLQEMAYIENMDDVKRELEKQKSAKEWELMYLKENKLLLECQCCFNDECIPSECLVCADAHIFCKECIRSGVDSKLGEGNTRIKCFTDCDKEIPLAVLQKALDPMKFSILLTKRQEAEVTAAGIEGIVCCPFCHFASIPPANDKIFKCLDPRCMKESCRLCKELNHWPKKCELTKDEKVRVYAEEKLTQALLRTCYRCKKEFLKDDGCNKITCHCGAMMCYVCKQPIQGYVHFNDSRYGGTGKCSLWSDSRMLDAQAVRNTAAAVKRQIQQENPDVKVDIDRLL